jgi:two-component system response regulator NreC
MARHHPHRVCGHPAVARRHLNSHLAADSGFPRSVSVVSSTPVARAGTAPRAGRTKKREGSRTGLDEKRPGNSAGVTSAGSGDAADKAAPVGRGLEDPVKVLLVDNRVLVREGICALIAGQPDFAVVAQVASVASAKGLDITPDLIVTEIDLPDAQQVDVISALRASFPQSAILVLTLVDHPAKVQSVLAAGADGYLLKTAATYDLLTGIRALAAGNTYLQPSLGVELARWHRFRDASGLSPTEERVLRLLALGHTNAQVAHLCEVSLRTVETHRARIHQKLGRRTRAELVQYAREVGLVALDGH